jgi:hypothetical protein
MFCSHDIDLSEHSADFARQLIGSRLFLTPGMGIILTFGEFGIAEPFLFNLK